LDEVSENPPNCEKDPLQFYPVINYNKTKQLSIMSLKSEIKLPYKTGQFYNIIDLNIDELRATLKPITSLIPVTIECSGFGLF